MMHEQTLKEVLQQILQRLDSLEANSATKQDLANLESRMATKDDIADLESRMATKEDIKNMATKDDIKNMATKDDILHLSEDIADIRSQMATKDDLKETNASVEKLSQKIDRIHDTLADHKEEMQEGFEYMHAQFDQTFRVLSKLTEEKSNSLYKLVLTPFVGKNVSNNHNSN